MIYIGFLTAEIWYLLNKSHKLVAEMNEVSKNSLTGQFSHSTYSTQS